MEKAMEEDQAMATATKSNSSNGNDYIGETWWFTSCDDKKADFERRVEKTKQRLATAEEDGVITTWEMGWVMLKYRAVAQTMAVGQKKKCAWVNDKSVNVKPLQDVVTSLKSKMRCFTQSQTYLDNNKDAANQDEVMLTGIAILTSSSSDCSVPDIQDTPASEVAAAEAAMQKDGDAEEEAFVQDPSNPGEDGDAEGRSDRSKTYSLLQKMSPENVQKKVQSMLETSRLGKLLEQNELDETTLSGGVMGDILGWFACLILWCIFCWVMMAVMMLILGLMMCMIKMVITAILRLFGSSRWDFEYGSCVGFWVGALGHGGDSSSMGLALCAWQTMKR